MKVDVERFSRNNLFQAFKFVKNVFLWIKVLKKVITPETFNVDFHNKFLKFWNILFFNLSSYIYIYIYTPPWGLSSLAKELLAAASVM